MSSKGYVGVAVPFTIDEVETLSAIAENQGRSLADFIRAQVFGPWDDGVDRADSNTEDLTTIIARLEGARIRARGRRRD